MDAIEAIGGSRPLSAEVFAQRAYDYALNPTRNSLKAILDQSESVEKTPPLLGGFNDIPWHKLREAEVHSWAKAGWSWIVNDAEHSQWECWYGREHNAIESRHGILPVQRLAREACSEHGDAYQLGARATMRPYGTTYEDAERYFRSVNFPNFRFNTCLHSNPFEHVVHRSEISHAVIYDCYHFCSSIGKQYL